METKEKEKITEAMKLCESKIQSFFSYLNDSLDKEESSKFKDLILANSFFAGGVFRSVLSDSAVSDIEIYFKSYDNIIEFKHLVLKQPIKLFKEVEGDSFTFKAGKGPKISFCCKVFGQPESVMQMFDLSIDMHYYDMQRMEMKFDRDTFRKAGSLNLKSQNKPRAIQRALKYMNQGFKIDSSSIVETIKQSWNKDKEFRVLLNPDKLNLIYKAYTESDYFGRSKEDSKVKKVLIKTLGEDSGTSTWATDIAEPEPNFTEEELLSEQEEEEQEDAGF